MMSNVVPLRPMTPDEAARVLASIGYSQNWSLERLRAAVPPEMELSVMMALRVTAAAVRAEATALARAFHLDDGDGSV